MASALLARTGRQRQRYDKHLRLVAGCIPFRLKQHAEDDSIDLLDRLEVLMISSPNRHDLVFPKGGWEDDETVDEAACREALEEAGVRGIIYINTCNGFYCDYFSPNKPYKPTMWTEAWTAWKIMVMPFWRSMVMTHQISPSWMPFWRSMDAEIGNHDGASSRDTRNVETP